MVEEMLLQRPGDRVAAEVEQGHVVAYRLTRRDHDGKVPPTRSRREKRFSKKSDEIRKEEVPSIEREVQLYII